MLRRVLICLAAVVLTGCSSAAPAPSPSAPTDPAPSATVAAPAGIPLTALGFTNAPDGLSLPAGLTITQRTDSANNITVVMSEPAGAEVLEHLRAALPAAGFTIDADRSDSLLFHDATWQGAFTVSGELSALTLRTDR